MMNPFEGNRSASCGEQPANPDGVLVAQQKVSFEVRQQDVPSPGWVVVAIWSDGREEQLVGVYTEEAFAKAWIEERAAIWLAHRNAELE